MTKKEILELTVRDLVRGLLFYDRKDDEELSSEDIDGLLEDGEVTFEEIVDWFRDELIMGEDK